MNKQTNIQAGCHLEVLLWSRLGGRKHKHASTMPLKKKSCSYCLLLSSWLFISLHLHRRLHGSLLEKSEHHYSFSRNWILLLVLLLFSRNVPLLTQTADRGEILLTTSTEKKRINVRPLWRWPFKTRRCLEYSLSKTFSAEVTLSFLFFQCRFVGFFLWAHAKPRCLQGEVSGKRLFDSSAPVASDLLSVLFCVFQDEVNQIVTSNVRLRQVSLTVEQQRICKQAYAICNT